MRRFYGFLVLVVSLLLVVFSNIQPQVSELTAGLEYAGGYETVYKVDFPDSLKSLEEIVKFEKRRSDKTICSGNFDA